MSDPTGKSLASKNPYPNTNDDMTDMFKWKHGQELDGSQAKKSVGGIEYRKDINRDWKGRRDKKKFYVDTFSTKKSMEDQFNNKE